MSAGSEQKKQTKHVRSEKDLTVAPVDNHRIKRNELLTDIPYVTIRKAWFTLSHLLLDEGSTLIDMGCGNGAMAYTMAALTPHINVIGVDRNKRDITKAKTLYKLPNLTFKAGNISGDLFEESSVDAIINSYTLHEVYSAARYANKAISDTLHTQFKALKTGGTMFIRDYARPPPGEYVQLEMPVAPSAGKDLKNMSETDLLLWYAEHARPRHDFGCGGFFLEELPARFPRTRLFRLPYKWAYEFIMRKDDRDSWDHELPMEYTFFTMREFRKELGAQGARVQYSAPYWDEEIIEDKFDGHFRLYNDDGQPLGNPATCYITVSQKMGERKSLSIEERRPSQAAYDGSLKIIAMRDEKTGKLHDIVTRDMEVGEIIPYRITQDGRLKVFLHDGIARGIANAVQRKGTSIDGKRWSGHMIEPISIDMDLIKNLGEINIKNTALFCRDHLGIKPYNHAVLEHGPDYFPAPDYIDERVQTYYLEAQNPNKDITPKNFIGHSARFQARGKIRELDAQHILNAISVGLIPSSRLELQILALFQRLGITSENWTQKELQISRGKITAQADLRVLLQSVQKNTDRFKEVKGATGELRTIHSIFVEEGQSQGGAVGLSYQDIDFVISSSETINTVVVLPLTGNEEGDLHAGFLLKHLPVPERFRGSAQTLSAPSFNLPKEITNLKQVKKFIAEKFEVAPEMVIKMGESYYNYVGITPQLIHPFAVAVPPDTDKDPDLQFVAFRLLMMMHYNMGVAPHLLLTIGRAYRFLHASEKAPSKHIAKIMMNEQLMGEQQPKWALPLHHHPAPKLHDGQKKKVAPKVKAKVISKKPQQQNAPIITAKKQETPAPIATQKRKKVEAPRIHEKDPKLELK